MEVLKADGYKTYNWHELFMQVAELMSAQSTCLRRRVGACLVRDKRIIATGYNGAISGTKHCVEIGCLRDKLNVPSGERQELCRSSHAEANCIDQCAEFGVSSRNSIMYVTVTPCNICAKSIISAKVKMVIFKDFYPDELALSYFREAEIKIAQLSKGGTISYPKEGKFI